MTSKLFIITSVILAVLAFQSTLGRPAREDRVLAEQLERQEEVSDPPSYGESSGVSEGNSDIGEDNENEEQQEDNDDEGETGEDGEEITDNGDEEGTTSTNEGVVFEEKQEDSNDVNTVQTWTDDYNYSQYTNGGVTSGR